MILTKGMVDAAVKQAQTEGLIRPGLDLPDRYASAIAKVVAAALAFGIEQPNKEPPVPERTKVADAMDVLREAMKDQPEALGRYAHSWHCNIAMMCLDAMVDGQVGSVHSIGHLRKISNDAAARFMKMCFNVNTRGQ